MNDSERDSGIRKSTVEKINGALADIDACKKRLLNAKAELGTAEAELRKAWGHYGSLRSKLTKLLPKAPVQVPTDEQAETPPS